jgi:hypothetical protein
MGMSAKFPTPGKVSERYRGEVSVGALHNWQAMRVGPAFVKIATAVLYPVDQLPWDQGNMVMCQRSSSVKDAQV